MTTDTSGCTAPARLTDAQIDAIAEAMPGGMNGFLKGWGWRQFARAVEDKLLGTDDAGPAAAATRWNTCTPPPHDSMEEAQMAARWWPQEAEPATVVAATSARR